MNIIKKICKKDIDNYVHKKFIRFGKGEFNRFLAEIRITSKNLKIKASYDWSNDLFKMIADNIKQPVNIKGKIIANYDFSSDLPCEAEEFGKKGKNYVAVLDCELNPEKMIELFEKLKENYILLNINSDEFKLKCGSKLPKPGKDPKINFCQATFPKELLKEFIFDIEETGKKIEIKNKLIVEDIKIPDECKNNPELARKKAIRLGKLVREVTIDDRKVIKEYDFSI